MRLLLPLASLCALLSVPVRADMFNITFSGSLSGSGTFTTDGTCSVCMPSGLGLLGLEVDIGPDSGMNAFDLSDDRLGLVFYQRGADFLSYNGTNSETGDVLSMVVEPNTWALTRANGSPLGAGTFYITPDVAIPEPSFRFLLVPIAALVGMRLRRHR